MNTGHALLRMAYISAAWYLLHVSHAEHFMNEAKFHLFLKVKAECCAGFTFFLYRVKTQLTGVKMPVTDSLDPRALTPTPPIQVK